MKAEKLTLLLLVPASQIGYGQDALISPRGIGAITLCSPLRDVQKLYPKARDTVMDSEDQEWKAKRIPLGNGEWILAESSWVDQTRIWRLTTNATQYVTINGIRVGDRIQALIDKHYEIDFNEGDGGYAFELRSPAFSFGFTTEEKYAKSFYEAIARKAVESKPLELPAARITTITVSADCGESPK